MPASPALAPRRLTLLQPRPQPLPFLGSSAAVRDLLAQADRLAATDLPVLITGESGTGKEVLARRVHALSRRRGGPFVAENCAAIPEALVESELFGHVRGAYTGAERDHDGAFAHAHGGTFLLDEIGDMPLAVQAKLLRVLETSQVRPLGSSSTRHVDVRVLCATHCDLLELVREGRFRLDLYYRLCGATLRIAPLRGRREDVAVLAQYFLDELNAAGGTRRRFAPRLLAQLGLRLWPGNVRELRNRIASLYHLADGDVLDDAELELGTVPERAPDVAHGLVTAVAPMAEIEKDAIRMALIECGGDRREAARVLQISRSSIYNKIRQYGLTSQEPLSIARSGRGKGLAEPERRAEGPPEPTPRAEAV